MCRHAKSCTLLGDDPAKWSRLSPLPPPDWFPGQLEIVRAAILKAAAGDRAGALGTLRSVRSDEMRFWFDEHGQVSGRHRVRLLGRREPAPEGGTIDSLSSPRTFEKEVFGRDRYTCRYCGLKLLSKEVLVAFERVVGTEAFRTRGTNAQQHGVVHAFKIVADHVVPHRRGGPTNPGNLVSACPGCNYGKEAFTLAELGLDDPRDRPPPSYDWDGLDSLVPRLKALNPTCPS